MSRRSKATTPTPVPMMDNASHPQDQYPVYRAFLMRSLDRCDTDLAALVELNRSLHTTKSAILESCGEGTLLDIGQGLVKLAQDGSDSLEGKIPKQGQDLCIDFLLRMKLRRKLLNRLSRRLGRLAHAMDGEDVQPPAPPKYGDLRLHIDPKSVEAFAERWRRQERAMKIIEQRRESFIPAKKEEPAPNDDQAASSDDKSEEKPAAGEEKMIDGEGTEGETKTSVKEGNVEGAEGTTADANAKEDVEMSEAAPGTDMPKDSEKPAEESKSDAGEQPAKEAESEPTAEETKSAPDAPPVEETKSGTPPTTPEEKTMEHVAEEDCLAALRDYDEAYTKEILPSTGTVKYPILNRNVEADHPKYGAGIGATHRTMSAKDKEMEYKRWQTAVLQRIPDQPTFEELGMANRVFFLEERRKRLAEEALASRPKKKQRKQTKKEESDSESEKESDDDSDEEMKDADDDEYEEDKAKDSDDEDEDEDSEMEGDMDGKEPKSKDKAKAESVPAKPAKPISLVAVPSFYEQDQKRVRMIHAELMATSIHDHTRLRITEATMEYNQAFRRSSQLYNHRMKLQTELNQVSYETRAKYGQLQNEYLREVAVHRQRWEKRHREHALALISSTTGGAANGTPSTASAASHPDTYVSNAAKAVADIVDCVVAQSEPGWNDEDPVEAFKPPLMPDFSETVLDNGETLGQRQERLEGGLRKQLTDIATQLHLSEEERKKAWKKLLKTKTDLDVPHSHPTGAGGRGTVSFRPNQLHLLPVPPLQAGGAAAVMPPTYNYPMASIPSYVPPATTMPLPSARPSASESKYSAAKVRERDLGRWVSCACV